MKILYLDCGMGASGDMLSGALYELLDEDKKDLFLRKINSLGIPGVSLSADKAQKCGIQGTHMRVTVDGVEEGSHDDTYGHIHDDPHGHIHDDPHGHIHDDPHIHTHHHSGMDEITHIIEGFSLSERVKTDISQVYHLIAEAESHVHGVPVPEIHFHEVGTMDAVTDVTASCLLMEMLHVDRVIASPANVGSGHVHAAHGILPVPAPATAYILRDVTIYAGDILSELCTPTGAALLKYFVSSFGPMPVMQVEKIGYGMGQKDFEAANCVRALLGRSADKSEQIVEFSLNVDDMTPEEIGFSLERFFEAGAVEAYTIPIGMKKSRPGHMISVMCKESDRKKVLREIFKHTSTLGVRENISRRYVLDRDMEALKTSFGPVRIKRSFGYGVTREKYEYDDLSRIAMENGLSISEVKRKLDKENENILKL